MKMQQQPEGKSQTRKLVKVHIEELVLQGFAPGDRHRIAAAVKEELSRLIIAEGVPASTENLGAMARLDAGAIQIRAGTSARATGARIGRAVYNSLRAQRGGSGSVRPGAQTSGVLPQ